MPRWVRFWLLCSLVYATPLALLVVTWPAFNWWWNWLVVAGPPVLGLGVGWALWRSSAPTRHEGGPSAPL